VLFLGVEWRNKIRPSIFDFLILLPPAAHFFNNKKVGQKVARWPRGAL
jgi:hypothetical protein